MIEAQHVANFFIEKSLEEGVPISQLKLLKLAYIGYGWSAAVLNRELFEEDIEAWKHGPVVPSLYHEFKRFGKDDIYGYAIDVDLDNPGKTKIPKIPSSEKDLVWLLSLVWTVYSRYSAWDLVRKTHEEGTPWHSAYEPGKLNAIPYDSIKTHFERKIREYLDAAARIERSRPA